MKYTLSIAFFALTAVSLPTLSHADARSTGDARIVKIRAGSQLKVKDPDQIIRTEIPNLPKSRRLLEAFQGVTVSPQDKQIGTRFSGKALSIEAASTAIGQVYQVTMTMRIRYQEREIRNRREIWVTKETKTEDETFTLVVDLPRLPRVQMGLDQMYWLVGPHNVTWKDAKAEKGRRLEVRSSDRKVTLIARATGKNEVHLRYEVGPTQLQRKLAISVKKKPLSLATTVEANNTTLLPIPDFEALTKLRDARIVDWRGPPGQDHRHPRRAGPRHARLRRGGRRAGLKGSSRL